MAYLVYRFSSRLWNGHSRAQGFQIGANDANHSAARHYLQWKGSRVEGIYDDATEYWCKLCTHCVRCNYCYVI